MRNTFVTPSTYWKIFLTSSAVHPVTKVPCGLNSRDLQMKFCLHKDNFSNVTVLSNTIVIMGYNIFR